MITKGQTWNTPTDLPYMWVNTYIEEVSENIIQDQMSDNIHSKAGVFEGTVPQNMFSLKSGYIGDIDF